MNPDEKISPEKDYEKNMENSDYLRAYGIADTYELGIEKEIDALEKAYRKNDSEYNSDVFSKIISAKKKELESK